MYIVYKTVSSVVQQFVIFQPKNLENALIFMIFPSLTNNQANMQTKECIYDV
jgi:hypothetical protein